MNGNHKKEEEEAAYWIQRLNLSKHPEGGYYRETYRDDRIIELDIQKRKEQENKDGKFKSSSSTSARSISSTIYYLLDGGQISALHRLRSADEIWHFYAGSSLTIYILEEGSKKLGEFRLGNNIQDGDMFQLIVRRGSWFGATVNDPSSYSLVGCTVSPAFDFEDFELGQRENLVEMYPEYKLIIEKLTRARA
jgi:predicted cupin superfamily sugar epimerase